MLSSSYVLQLITKNGKLCNSLPFSLFGIFKFLDFV